MPSSLRSRRVVLGSAVTNLQAQRRRKPGRTAAERMVRTWTLPERRAIEQVLAAGRVVYAPRGRSGLPERPSFTEQQAAGTALVIAMKPVRAAAQ